MAGGMACGGFTSFLLVILAMAGVAMATTYIVGDDKGWTLPSVGNINYTAWAANHTFVVGDILHFEYTANAHTVQPLSNGTSFAACDLLSAVVPAFTGGSTDITLKSAGSKWYVCGVGEHCKVGMKFKIKVIGSAEGPAPPPTAGGPVHSTRSHRPRQPHHHAPVPSPHAA